MAYQKSSGAYMQQNIKLVHVMSIFTSEGVWLWLKNQQEKLILELQHQKQIGWNIKKK